MSCSSDDFKPSRAPLDNPLNTGLYYMKSTNRTIQMMKYWRAARERFPGQHDQAVFVNIRHELVSKLQVKIEPLDRLLRRILRVPRRPGEGLHHPRLLLHRAGHQGARPQGRRRGLEELHQPDAGAEAEGWFQLSSGRTRPGVEIPWGGVGLETRNRLKWVVFRGQYTCNMMGRWKI